MNVYCTLFLIFFEHILAVGQLSMRTSPHGIELKWAAVDRGRGKESPKFCGRHKWMTLTSNVHYCRAKYYPYNPWLGVLYCEFEFVDR
jgi:hypothetical protein